ncbi:acetyltransferase [Maribellus maritimus]|uniref:acetyltransferase n=1 Tax=Maribellus maritimus TaxID=2870838 RepID=UPI001EE9D0C4|nr:acetyltransferase [Maribellus maritimus]MCG6191214.1 acetyltransferase [Maribellus maritimus]
MKEPIVLIGGGGHCISCIDVIELTGQYEIAGILDQKEKIGQSVLNYMVTGSDESIKKLAAKGYNFLITVGQIKSSNIRRKIFEQVKKEGGKLPVIISPLAYVSKYATVAEGTIVMHHVLVNANASVGKSSIINSKALIEHETTVGDFCHISTGAKINGQADIGGDCFIGSNATVGNNISVCEKTIVTAGSQVLKNIRLSGVYIGNPLRKIR